MSPCLHQHIFTFSFALAPEMTQPYSSLQASWQINSWCAAEHKHQFHHKGGGRNMQLRARTPFLGSSLHFRVSLMQLSNCSLISIAKIFYLTLVSTICKGGGRVRSWSHLYNPSSSLLCFSSSGIHFIPLILLPRITITIIPYALLIGMKNHRIIWAERHVWKSSDPTPCSEPGLAWFVMC